MPPIQLTNEEFAIQNAILSDALALPDGRIMEYGGDFLVFHDGMKLGVAIPTGEEYKDIHNVKPGRCFLLEGRRQLLGAEGNYLTLTADTSELDLSISINQLLFGNMMFLFVQTKDNNRERIIEDPWTWARNVIDINGNESNEEKPYPYVAELYLVNRLCQAGLMTNVAYEYRGPEAGTHDFELPSMSLEAKSHKRAYQQDKPDELVISSEHQLDRTGDKPLYVVYFQMQDVGEYSLRSCVEEFGAHRQILLEKLKKTSSHFVEGDFAWEMGYSFLGEPKVYEISNDFPRITPGMFIDHHFPSGITNLIYRVSLRNQPFCTLTSFLEAIREGQQPVFNV